MSKNSKLIISVTFVILISFLLLNFSFSDREEKITKSNKTHVSNKNWYNNYLHLQKDDHTGKGVHISIIDTSLTDKNRKKVENYFAINGNDINRDTITHGDMMLQTINSISPNLTIDFYAISNKDNQIKIDSFKDALTKSINNDVRVISMSFNFPFPIDSIKPLLDKAREEGILVVNSAGNDGSNIKTYPASYSSVIAVSGINKEGIISESSNYGKYIDFSFPDSISIKGATESGTSVSAALLTGFIGRLMEKYPNKNSEQIYHLLIKMCGKKEKSYMYGYGTPMF